MRFDLIYTSSSQKENSVPETQKFPWFGVPAFNIFCNHPPEFNLTKLVINAAMEYV